MFEKKFKVRVMHFSEDWYQIQYAYYRIFPNYKSINYWFDCGFTGNLEAWCTEILKIKEAEEFAKTLKSIEDVNKYYQKENVKRREFYKEKNKFKKTNIPYKSKQII